MTTTEIPLADRLIQVTIPLADGSVTVTGERTDCPYLAIAPGFAKDGVSDVLVLMHIPTGHRLPVLPLEKARLRKLATAVAHLDWDFTDPAGFTAETREGFLAARRKIESGEGEEIFAEYPKGWGRDGEIPGDAASMVRWLLDGWQATHDHMHSDKHPNKIPMDGPDGKPNWEWIAGSLRQVDVFGLAYVLAALQRINPAVADHVAAFLAEQWASGDSLGEWVWQWRHEIEQGEPLKLPAVPSPEPAEGEFLMTTTDETPRTCVYTLCGSTRFPDAFALANMHLSTLGHIVIGLGMMGHADEPRGARFLTSDGNESTAVKQALDRLHFAKIDQSDAIYVVNVGGCVDSSTRREIAYARSRNKDVEWMFPDAIPGELEAVA